jgi:uncharacterized oligopeptide transporter (OPT) family protein
MLFSFYVIVNECGFVDKRMMKIDDIIKELNERKLPDKIVGTINTEIEELNSTSLIGKELRKLAKHKQTKILELLEKELKIVPKNHYRTFWMMLGMSAFGVPIGVLYGIAMDNMALIGIGLCFGMAVGLLLGSRLDKKALKEGRQLGVEIKY